MTRCIFPAVSQSSDDQRTDYTYARTGSYLPFDLASPTADRQKPNMKRYAIRRRSLYNANTSTSHCGDFDSVEHPHLLLRGQTIPVSNSYESICQQSSHSNDSSPMQTLHGFDSADDVGHKKPVHVLSRTARLLRFAIPGCLMAAILVYLAFNTTGFGTDSRIQSLVRDGWSRMSGPVVGEANNSQDARVADVSQLRNDIDNLVKRIDQLSLLMPYSKLHSGPHSEPRRIHTPMEKSNSSSTADCKCCIDILKRYDNDKTGLLDFAHASMGAQIYSVGCTKPFKAHALSLSSKVDPAIVLKSNLMPGECWPFKGANGSIAIRIAHSIYPFGMTYEHIDQSISLHNDNAPYKFSVNAWNIDQGRERIYHLGICYFSWNETKIKTFYFQNVPPDLKVNVFEINVQQNWGNKEQTCLYRFRIHGHV